MAEADTGPPRKKVKKFQDDWLREYTWLEYEDGKMYCTICKKNKKTNTFTKGCADTQHSSLTRHCSTDSHKSAFQATKSAAVFSSFVKKAESKSSDSVLPQLKTVHFMVCESMSLSKFSKLIDLQVSNGANISGIYRHSCDGNAGISVKYNRGAISLRCREGKLCKHPH